MTNIMSVGWRLSSENFTTLILMDLDLNAGTPVSPLLPTSGTSTGLSQGEKPGMGQQEKERTQGPCCVQP